MQRHKLKNNNLLLFDSISVQNRFALVVGFYPGALDPQENGSGLHHLLEHMLFKSDEYGSQQDKIRQMEWSGIDITASTSYGLIKISCTGPIEKIGTALQMISNMWKAKEYNIDELESEKQVVLEELKMYQNNPADYVNEWVLSPQLFYKTPLAHSLLGTRKSIADLTIDDLLRAKLNKNTIISISAQISQSQKDTIIEMCQREFGCNTTPTNSQEEIEFQPLFGLVQEIRSGIDQSFIERGYIVPSASHKDYLKMLLLSYILDGGLSSRAFQELREVRALGYAVGARYDEDYGFLVFYIHGCEPEKVMEAQEAFTKILHNVQDITLDELNGMKQLLRSHLLERITSLETLATTNVDNIVYQHKYTDRELLEVLEETTIDDIIQMSREVLAQKPVDAVLNPEQES